MVRKIMAIAVAFILIAFHFSSPLAKAADAGPPDGEYNCHKISSGQLIGLGTLDIRGKTYRVGKEDSFAPFTMDGAGNIDWSAGINFMPDGWKILSSAYKGLTKEGQPLIIINYRSKSGNNEVMDCVKE
jgi:hypothetical protein